MAAILKLTYRCDAFHNFVSFRVYDGVNHPIAFVVYDGVNLSKTCVGSKNYKGPSVTQNIKSSPFLYEAKEVYKGAMWNASIDAFNEINEDRQLWILNISARSRFRKGEHFLPPILAVGHLFP